MAFKYACFISYRHGKEELMTNMMEDIHNALSSEIEAYVGRDRVFRDKIRLQGGDFLDINIAKAIYESVCMVIAYTPSYFDRNDTFCAREFKAMEQLEEKRLKLLPKGKNEHGLIIPIILRGQKFVPKEIKSRRLYFNFGDFLLSDGKMIRHPKYAPQIKRIAEYINDRCVDFSKIAKQALNVCRNFQLPTDAEIAPWLESVTCHKLPFPGREEI